MCGSSAPSTQPAVESTVHSVGPYRFTVRSTPAAPRSASRRHSAGPIASPPTSRVNGRGPPSAVSRSSSGSACEGVMSRSVRACSSISRASSAGSARVSSSIMTRVSPRQTRTHCCTEASKDGEAFQPTRPPSVTAMPASSSSASSADAAPRTISTPLGRPVEPEV